MDDCCFCKGYKAEGLAISIRVRGLMAEFGVVVARSDHALRRALGDEAMRQQLPAMLHALLDDLEQHVALRQREYKLYSLINRDHD